MKFTFLFLFLAFTLSCGSASDGEAPLIDIPSISSECFFAQSPACISGNSGAPIFVGISEDRSLDCHNFMNGILLPNLQTGFIASGFSFTSYRSSSPAAMIATHSTWVGGGGAPINTLPNNSYKYCALIDINGNNQADSLEPFLEQEGLLSELDGALPLGAWSSF